MANDSTADISAPQTRSTEGDTRRQVMLSLLKVGPVTAVALGERLGISAAGVRRHLDILVEDGLAETVHRNPQGSTRGRPAKHFRLTDRGRDYFGHAYDALATDALEALRKAGGSDAVREFARQRVRRLLAAHDSDLQQAPPEDLSVEETAEKLAQVFDDNGYAATVKATDSGIQVCQHHCPVAHVASEHPELCEAEHEVITEFVGQHVQPLATIAEGHGICTTNIPLAPQHHHNERSGS